MLTASLTGSDARRAALELAGAATDFRDAATAQKALDSAGAGASGDDAAAAILRLRQAEVLVLQRRFRDGATGARRYAPTCRHRFAALPGRRRWRRARARRR